MTAPAALAETGRFASNNPLIDACFDQPDFEGTPRLAYVVGSTRRSGSTYLSSLLAATGVLGVPTEYLKSSGPNKDLLARAGQDPEDRSVETYAAALTRLRTTPNGVFGLHAHFDQFAMGLRHQLFGRLLPAPRFLYIRRRDLLGQAISLIHARQTDRWTSLGEASGAPSYDGKAIREALHGLIQQNANWELYFAEAGAEPFLLFYEDLVAEPERLLAGICAFLGVEWDGRFAQPRAPLERQADPVKQLWRERFLAERQGG